MTHLVQDSVGGALRFVRERWRVVLIGAGAGAVATALIAVCEAAAPALNPLIGFAAGVMQTFIYATFVAAALRSEGDRLDLSGGFRLWAAMVVIAFFLFIVFFVLMIPGAVVMLAGPMAADLPQLEHAGANQAAVMNIMSNFAAHNPAPVIAFFLFYAILWLLLTSRLYVAAPATVDQKRILTFETWKWTQGQTLRIAAARIILLAPAYVLVWALTYLVGRVFGVDPMNVPDSAAGTPGYIAYTALFSFLTFTAYSALEAGLSTAFYKALRPRDGALPRS